MTMTMKDSEADNIPRSVESKAQMSSRDHRDELELITEPNSPDTVDLSLDSEVGGRANCIEEDTIPDGDSNADLRALLAYSKSRLEKQSVQQIPPHLPDDEQADISENEDGDEAAIDEVRHAVSKSNSEEEQLEIAKAKIREAEAKAAADDDEMEALREMERVAEDKLHIAEASDAETETVEDNDPSQLLRLAEKKVKEAEEKARKDEEEIGANVLKPTISTTKRSEANSELWALLNYSKMRVETGTTPQLRKKANSLRGDDVSVSSKGTSTSKISVSSKTSKKSIALSSVAPVSVVGDFINDDSMEGAIVDDEMNVEKVSFPDLTGDNASVDGSVGNSCSGDDDDHDQEFSRGQSDKGNDSEDGSDDEEEEEEEELPSFLRDDNKDVDTDPAETKRLYEEAKLKAASILSVPNDENITEVQMLQALAIAQEAANNGADKFSTKRSLFRLNEAKLEDLKSLLDFGGINGHQTESTDKASCNEIDPSGWGIGRGRFMRKLGAAYQDLKERCDEIDERKKQERSGQPSNAELFNAAFDDLKKQIDEYEQIVKSKK